MKEYIKLFNNHTQYETYKNSADFVTPNVSYCRQQDEVHYHEFEYIVYFDNFVSSDVNIIDSDTQEVLYTIDSTHYGPFNMKKNKTYIARLVNGQTTQTQRPCDWSFSSDDIVDDYVYITHGNLYEYNIGYETLGIGTCHEQEDYYWICNYEALLDNDKDYILHDATYNQVNVVNQKFRDYAVNNNKANYIEFYYDNHALKARIKNTQTNEIVNVGSGHCEFDCEEANSILFAQTLPLSDYTMRNVDTNTKYLQMDIWCTIG